MHKRAESNILESIDIQIGRHPMAPKMLVSSLLNEGIHSSTEAGHLVRSINSARQLLSCVGSALIGTLVLLLIVACCSNAALAAAGQSNAGQSNAGQPGAVQSNPDTFFGRLSQRFQLGSTEEVITYKLPVGPFFATIRGDVLLERPAYLDVVLTEQKSGMVRSDLEVVIDLCQIADETVNYMESCEAFDGPLYEYTLDASWQNGAYRADGFKWETDGNWQGKMTVTVPATGEVEVVEIWPYIYPKRPASTNLFELVSVFLPFVALGLFVVGLRATSGRLTMKESR